MPHKHIAYALGGTVLGAMITSATYMRWPDAQSALLGNVGWLPFLVAVATLVFLAFNSSIAQRNLENTTASLQQSQKAEVATRFQKGLELIESSSAATRVGGIAVLRDVATQAPQQYWLSVSTVLANLVEQHTLPLHEKIISLLTIIEGEYVHEETEQPKFERTGADVVAAIEVLSLKSQELRNAVNNYGLPTDKTLKRVALSGASFVDIDLRNIAFEDAILQSCTFVRCNLDQTTIEFITLGANFRGCTMKATSIEAKSTIWSGDSINLTSCDLDESYFFVTGGAPVAIVECNVSGAWIYARNVDLQACWNFERTPKIRAVEGEVQYANHQIDTQDVTGCEPLLIRYGMSIYRKRRFK